MSVNSQIFCEAHGAGPFNQDSEQKIEHERTEKDCNWKEYDPKLHVNNYNESEVDDPDKITEIESLIEIENPQLSGKNIMVNATLASNSISYSVPSRIKGFCSKDDDKGKHNCISSAELDLDGSKLVQFVDVSDYVKESQISKTLKTQTGFQDDCRLSIEETQTTTLKRIRIRPIVSSLEKNDGKFFDGDGNEWKSYDAYFRQDKIQTLEAGTEIKIIGKVIPDPKNQKVTLLISKCSSVEKKDFDISHIESLKQFCQNKTPSEIVDFYCKEFEYFSKIIKRKDVTICGLLTFFSLTHIEFEGSIIAAWLKSLIIGDTTTGKSETVRNLIKLLHGGQIVSGETASTVGLGGTTTQASNSSWFIEWGPLVLQDKKLLAIDGAHKLSREQWATLAESERTGKIQIIKAGKGEAYARTRQIKIMNPIGDDFRTPKTMKSFYYPAQSIVNNLQIQSIARQDIAVFVSDDVSTKELNIQNGQIHDKKLEHLADLLNLVWEQNFKVTFTDDAMQEILSSSIEIQNRFKHDEIPLITNDQKHKMIKMAASLAAMTCSFNEDFSELTIKKEHVQYIHDFINTNYHNSGLDIISENDRDDLDSDSIDAIIFEIKQSLKHREPEVNEKFCKKVLLWCVQKTKFSKEQLTTAFELAETNQYRPLIGTLKNLNLINHRSLTPTSKLIKLAKILLEEKSESEGGINIDDGNNGKDGKTSNLTTVTTVTTPKYDTPPTPTLQGVDIACNRCSTLYKNTVMPLEFMQKRHSENNPGHTLHIVEEEL